MAKLYYIVGQAIVGSAALALVAIHPASATTIFQEGNAQYTNVNIAADTDAFAVTGDIGNTGMTMTFNSMVGPAGQSPYEIHGQHGVAFVESFADVGVSTASHTGWTSLTLTAAPGTAWNAGDFKLDLIQSVTSAVVTLAAFDGTTQNNSPIPTQFTLGHGQNEFNFFTKDGEMVTSITISVPIGFALDDIKQVSLDAFRTDVVPLPASLPLFASGAGVIGLLVRRRKRKAAAASTNA